MLIKPFKSVGNLLFTDDRATIREKLNTKFESGVKGQGDFSDQYDYFNTEGFFIYYDKKDNVNVFEFFEGNLFLDEINLLKMPYNALVKHFAAIDHDLHIDYNGFTSYNYGIGGNTNDDLEDPAALTEAIIIFKEGYYD